MKVLFKKWLSVAFSAAIVAATLFMPQMSMVVHAETEEDSILEPLEDGFEVDVADYEILGAVGDLASNPVDAEIGVSYSKSWTKYTYSTNHYVRFSIDESGVILITASKPYDSRQQYGTLEFVVYNESLTPVWGTKTSVSKDDPSTTYSFFVGLDAGTYILTIKPGFSVSSGTISTNYIIGFIPTAINEIEPNDSANQATVMTLNNLYLGDLGNEYSSYEKSDYWKVYLTAGNTYVFALGNYTAIDNSTCIVKLTDPDGHRVYLSRLAQNYNPETELNYDSFIASYTGWYFVQLYNYSGKQFGYTIGIHSDNYVTASDVELDCSSLDMFVGEERTINARVVPEESNDSLTWGVTDDSVIALSGSGNSVTVRAVSEGTAQVWVQSGGVRKYCAVTAKRKVIVYPNFSEFTAPEGCVYQFRLYNPNSGEHFYTGSQEETINLIDAGWNFEGSGFITPTVGIPIYRLYSSEHGDHFYTTSETERDALLADHWTLDGDTGIAFPSAPAETGRPMYRLHNPNAYPNGEAGAHHFTMSWEEVENLQAEGWQYEFIAWYSV